MSAPLSVVFYWHMHQPFYREADTGRYHLPWVYLHAMKDYTDMAEIIARIPGARAVINYVPSLTAQIEDYARHIQDYLAGNADALNDPLLCLLAAKRDFNEHERAFLLTACFRLNHERNLHRYPAYSRLWHLAEHARQHDATRYLGQSFFSDLVTWYHLAWLAETVRQHHFTARRLIEQGAGFTHQDRIELLTLIGQLLHDIPARHRALRDQGKIELTTTPYAHPIIPLLLDFHAARETIADAAIPAEPYPGGDARARDHIQRARDSHMRVFGHMPEGIWPAEGAVSEATLALLAEAGFQWCATGEAVLHHSLGYNVREHEGGTGLYQPWRVARDGRAITCFFRDDRLSDLIGFEYSRWDTQDALNHFMHELARIREQTRGMAAPIVAIIMDGENAWEHYHENALPFLSGLYQRIIDHEDYTLTTFRDYLRKHPAQATLPRLVAGSWVYGNLATWIGDPAKTHAWELLIAAKKAFDAKIDTLDPERRAMAEEQLRICEGSDWCWWFGDYNPSDVVRDFDRLYRQHLRKLYTLLDQPVPPALELAISEGGGQAEGGGTMRRGGAGA